MTGRLHRYWLIICVLLGLLTACTQYKNKFINRTYHDVTTHFNVYFYARESIKEGIDNLEAANHDDYTELLPVFIYGDDQTCKAIFPQMDKAIKKASIAIQRHAIKDKKSKIEIPNTGRWIDDCWITIGKAHFYKREFFSGIEALEYVASAYKTKQKYEAWLWLMKTYNELNALSQSDSYISLIKNDKKFPAEYKPMFEAQYAEFYIKQGMYDQGIKHLENAIKITKSKKSRARYNFILGQLYEQKGQINKARMHYYKCIKLKPVYDMVFYAKIKLSLLNNTPEGIENTKKELKKMIKDIKNSDLLDVIYFTLGQLEENQKHVDEALAYYRLAVRNSNPVNVKQKVKSYLKLADINFERENYVSASGYYDSTIAIINDSYPGYVDIKTKKTSLDTLVKNINIVKVQDSLLRVANMDTLSRDKYIKQIIKKLQAEEEEAEARKQAAQAANSGMTPTQLPITQTQSNPNGGPAQWYFYNPMLKAQGLNDFIKRWGANRKNEDNWRRSNRSTYNFDDASADTSSLASGDSSVAKKDTNLVKLNDKHQVFYYLKKLPLTQADKDSSNSQILDAYYALGSIYRELLNNSKKSAESFETMNKRYPENKYEPASYYQLYRIYVQQKNDVKAAECKQYLLSHYPKSDYAKIVNDPDFASSVNAKQGEVEAVYKNAYEAFSNKNYAESYAICDKSLLRFGKGVLSPKFAYLKALSAGYLYGMDSLEKYMLLVTLKYPNTEVHDPAKATVELIKKQRKLNEASDSTATPADSTYKYNEATEHYCCIIVNSNVSTEALKNKISDINKEYYSTSNYEIMAMPKGNETIIGIHTFKSKEEAMSYYTFIVGRQELYTGLNKKDYYVMCISASNLAALLKAPDITPYKTFFNDKYLGQKP